MQLQLHFHVSQLRFSNCQESKSNRLNLSQVSLFLEQTAMPRGQTLSCSCVIGEIIRSWATIQLCAFDILSLAVWGVCACVRTHMHLHTHIPTLNTQIFFPTYPHSPYIEVVILYIITNRLTLFSNGKHPKCLSHYKERDNVMRPHFSDSRVSR